MSGFDNLIQEQIPRLRRYARALVSDQHRADDLVQDSLERAWSKQHLWCSDQPIRPWLFTIMYNVYANSARQYNRSPQLVSIDDQHERQDGFSRDDCLQSNAMFLRDFERALATLEDNHREVLLLVGLEQLSYKETAEVLNIPHGTVMSRLSRAREKLSRTMGRETKAIIRRVK